MGEHHLLHALSAGFSSTHRVRDRRIYKEAAGIAVNNTVGGWDDAPHRDRIGGECVLRSSARVRLSSSR